MTPVSFAVRMDGNLRFWDFIYTFSHMPRIGEEFMLPEQPDGAIVPERLARIDRIVHLPNSVPGFARIYASTVAQESA